MWYITICSQMEQIDLGELQPSDSFVFAFVETGGYSYQCPLAGTLRGTVTVSP